MADLADLTGGWALAPNYGYDMPDGGEPPRGRRNVVTWLPRDVRCRVFGRSRERGEPSSGPSPVGAPAPSAASHCPSTTPGPTAGSTRRGFPGAGRRPSRSTESVQPKSPPQNAGQVL